MTILTVEVENDQDARSAEKDIAGSQMLFNCLGNTDISDKEWHNGFNAEHSRLAKRKT